MAQVGMHEAIAGYLAGLEPRTARNYKPTVRAWLTWCSENGIDPMRVTGMHIEAYGRWLREQLGMSKHTTYHRMSVVRGLYRYAHHAGAIESDPGEHVRMPRLVGHSEGTYLTREQAGAFIEASKGRGRAAHAACCLMLLCGMRVSEALGLDVPDCSLGDSPTVRVRRKGDWRQVVSVPPRVADALREAIGRRQSGPVIVVRGKRMSQPVACKVVSEVAAEVGAEGITPHSLRRTFCTLARDAKVPDHDIMATGGWSSPHMLDYYDMGRRSLTSTAPSALDEYISSR